ncbi:hypothetical protein [Alkalihalobacillus sp. BA299]|uniref:hypothetical protein n=1 Tax=Alkalihalobacillus sp. BA299 TaxID=2815938 RepID=UPI001ADAA5AA|nr:hypothetical protein [Alkalihalobacillus sp. BA299]
MDKNNLIFEPVSSDYEDEIIIFPEEEPPKFGSFNYFKEKYDSKIENLLDNFLDEELTKIIENENCPDYETKKLHLKELAHFYYKVRKKFELHQDKIKF